MESKEVIKIRYRISEVLKRTGLHRATLNFYINEGLVTPTETNEAGLRFFSPNDIEGIQTIIRLRKGGIPLKEIKEKLRGK